MVFSSDFLRVSNIGIIFAKNHIEKVKVLVFQSCPTLCNTMDYIQPARLLYPRNSPGKNTGACCHSHFQGFFLTHGSNLGLLHCMLIIYHLSHQGSPKKHIKLKILFLILKSLVLAISFAKTKIQNKQDKQYHQKNQPGKRKQHLHLSSIREI